MATLTKCDICSDVVERNESYYFNIYKRNDKTSTKNDVCHKCFRDVLDKGLKPKWQQWLPDSTGKTKGKYVDIS